MNKIYDLDSMVIFDSRQIHIEGEPACYGFLFSTQCFKDSENLETLLHKYVVYLVGVEKWLQEGYKIDARGNWWSKDGKKLYHYHDKELYDYRENAFKENPVAITIKTGCKPVYQTEHLADDGIFIISEEYKNWKMEGEE